MMGVFTDALAEIRATERTMRARELVGCEQRQCLWGQSYDVGAMLDVVRHNEASQAFDLTLYRDPYQDYVGYTDRDALEWRPAMPRAIADWIAEQHTIEDEAKITADPWREHAAMVSG